MSESEGPSADDLYKILGISKDATNDDIKNAHRQLVKKYHPDTNSNSESKEKFLKGQQAYSVLSDEEKRKAYDKGEKIPGSKYNKQSALVENFLSILLQVVDSQDDSDKDPFVLMAIHFANSTRDLLTSKKQCRRRIKKAKRMLKKCKGPIFIQRLWIDRISEMNRTIANIDEQLAEINEMQKILGQCEFSDNVELSPDELPDPAEPSPNQAQATVLVRVLNNPGEKPT